MRWETVWVRAHGGQQQHWHCDTALHDIHVAACSPPAVGCHFRLTYMTFVAAHATLPSHFWHLPPAAKTSTRQVVHILRFVCIFCLSGMIPLVGGMQHIYTALPAFAALHVLSPLPSRLLLWNAFRLRWLLMASVMCLATWCKEL